MVEPRRGPGLAPQSFSTVAHGHVGADLLEGDPALEALIPGLPHRSHPAAAEQLVEPVRTEPLR
jgi:hypothetical protein